MGQQTSLVSLHPCDCFQPKEIASMTKLNHINLAVSDVPELTRFFQAGFGFRVTEQRGSGKFAVLLGEDGFALILMHDKKVALQHLSRSLPHWLSSSPQEEVKAASCARCGSRLRGCGTRHPGAGRRQDLRLLLPCTRWRYGRGECTRRMKGLREGLRGGLRVLGLTPLFLCIADAAR